MPEIRERENGEMWEVGNGNWFNTVWREKCGNFQIFKFSNFEFEFDFFFQE